MNSKKILPNQYFSKDSLTSLDNNSEDVINHMRHKVNFD